MPVTKSAKRAFRKSLRRKALNDWRRNLIKQAVKNFKKAIKAQNKEEAQKWLRQIYKQVDKAAKRFFYKNKANRLKARYAKLLVSNKKS